MLIPTPDVVKVPPVSQNTLIGIMWVLTAGHERLRTHLDLNDWKSIETPLLHPLFIEPNRKRRRYPIQMQGDLQIAPMLAQESFCLLQCLILG